MQTLVKGRLAPSFEGPRVNGGPMRMTEGIILIAILLIAALAVPRGGTAQEPVVVNNRLHPIQQCWYMTWHRHHFDTTNSTWTTLSSVDFPDAGSIRVTNVHEEDGYLFCPFMSDDDLSHMDAEQVRLEGFATGNVEIAAWVCVDDPLGTGTSCTDVLTYNTSSGVIDFTTPTLDSMGGWLSGDDYSYPYIVYQVSGGGDAHLVGYRVEREG